MASGRKTGSPSPPTGVCVAAPDVPWGRRGQAGLQSPPGGARGASGRSGSLSSEARAQTPASSLRHKLQPDGSLVIRPLRAEDAGIYSCGGSRQDGDSPKIQLRVIGRSCVPAQGISMGPRREAVAGRARAWVHPRRRGPSCRQGPCAPVGPRWRSRPSGLFFPHVPRQLHGPPPSFRHILRVAHLLWPPDRG